MLAVARSAKLRFRLDGGGGHALSAQQSRNKGCEKLPDEGPLSIAAHAP
jgi:hypothetical protein